MPAMVFVLSLVPPVFAQDDAHARTRSLLLSAPAWIVRWSAPQEAHAQVVVVRFRLEEGTLFAATENRDGSRCYPDIRVRLQGEGFLFHGCTGVPKEMRFDAAHPAVPFKGRAFGFSYLWTRSD